MDLFLREIKNLLDLITFEVHLRQGLRQEGCLETFSPGNTSPKTPGVLEKALSRIAISFQGIRRILTCNLLGCFLGLLKLDMECLSHNTWSSSNICACINFIIYIPPGVMSDLEQTLKPFCGNGIPWPVTSVGVYRAHYVITKTLTIIYLHVNRDSQETVVEYSQTIAIRYKKIPLQSGDY